MALAPIEDAVAAIARGEMLVVTTEQADRAAVGGWRDVGAEVAVVPPAAAGGGVDLAAALELLGQRGVLQAMVEGGAAVHGALVAADLVDRLVLYVGGCLLGERGRPMVAWPGPASIDAAPRWRLVEARALDRDARLEYEPAREEVV